MAVLVWSGSALADANAGMAAMKAQDYTTAIKEFRLAAEAGDVRVYRLLGSIYEAGSIVPKDFTEAANWYRKGAEAGNVFCMAQLARLYAQGKGVPRDIAEAKRWAGRSAESGEAEGHLWLYVIALMTDLSYLDANGKPDVARYQVLSSRPIAERKAEIDAYENLAKAAAKGNVIALNFYLTYLMEHLAAGNGKRFRDIYTAQSSVPWMPAVRNGAGVLDMMDKLGSTLVSPKVFMDAQTSVMLAALIEYGAKHKELGGAQKKECLKSLKPVRLEVSNPLQGEEWMPFRNDILKQTYLVKGTWTEKWTYSVCGEEIPVEVVFSADGLGGARFTSTPQKSPAPQPASTVGGL